MRTYVYAVLGHARSLLRGLLLVTRVDERSAAFPIARALFELGCHAVLIDEKIAAALAADDLEAAISPPGGALYKALMGNRHLRDQGVRTEDDQEWISPFRVGAAVSASARLLREPADGEWGIKEVYSVLCEFTHPNMGALSLHHDYVDAETNPRVVFGPTSFMTPPLNEAPLALALVVNMSAALLDRAGDATTHAALASLTDALRLA
jgi:hypothetical protein